MPDANPSETEHDETTDEKRSRLEERLDRLEAKNETLRNQVERQAQELDSLGTEMYGRSNLWAQDFNMAAPIDRIEGDGTVIAERHGTTVFLSTAGGAGWFLRYVPWWCRRYDDEHVKFTTGELTIAGAEETIKTDDASLTWNDEAWTYLTVDKAVRYYMELDFVAKEWTLKQANGTGASLPAWPTGGSGKIIFRLASVNWNATDSRVTYVQNHNVGAIQIPG